MKNTYILKGWFNMEEFKKGAISEEALDEIAGGLSISKSTVKNVLIAAGIGVLAAGGATALAVSKSGKGKSSVSPEPENDINKIDVNYFDGDEQDIADLNDGKMPKLRF